MYSPVPTPERSFRRSRDREAVFDELRERGRATLGELSLATGVPPSRVWGVVMGDPPRYSAALSLAGVGVVRVVWDPRGEAFELTREGAALGDGEAGEPPYL